MRPKSMATAVAVLVADPKLSSTPIPAWVMVSSVVSGRISLTEPTMVVLPTPNPPTITIFAAAWAVCGNWSSVRGPGTVSEPLKSMHHRFEKGTVRERLPDDRGARLDEFRRQHLGEQHRHDAERKAEVGRQLGHGQGCGTEPEQCRLLGGGRRRGVLGARHDERDEVEFRPAAVRAGDDVQAFRVAALAVLALGRRPGRGILLGTAPLALRRSHTVCP